MKNTLSILAISLLLVFISCEKTMDEKEMGSHVYSMEGHAQKGPFIIGSNVTVAELNDKLYPTGRIFYSTILDNDGYFELPQIALESPYVQIRVEGSYFSEIDKGVSNGAKLTLYSLADIRDQTNLNVNILTHLEKKRVEYLVQHENKEFQEAKQQALNELLAVFSLESGSLENSSGLEIFGGDSGNAVLLAISLIVESTGDFVERLELMTTFQKDFEDGILDSEVIQTTLLNSAAYRLNPDLVTSTLVSNFPGKDFPDFELYINQFIENSTYTDYFKNIFPELPSTTINLLSDTSIHEIDPLKSYVLAFSLSPENTEVSIEIQIEQYYKPGEGKVIPTFVDWTTTYLQTCSDPSNIFCHNYQLYKLYNSASNAIIPLTFTGHGEFFYQVNLSAENYKYSWTMNTNGGGRFVKW